MLAIEGLIPNEGRIPHNGGHWRNFSGSQRKKTPLQEVRLGRPNVGSSQSYWIYINTPNLRARVTEIEEVLRGSLKKHAVATAGVKDGVVSFAYRPLD